MIGKVVKMVDLKDDYEFFILQKSPSSRTICSKCGTKILEGQIRLEICSGSYHNMRQFTHVCQVCAEEVIEKEAISLYNLINILRGEINGQRKC
jgi:hypothetical protein